METKGLEITTLMNDVILRQIFSELDVADLKSCRLVNTKWNVNANTSFIARSVCCIKNNKTEKENVLNEFEKCFENSSVWPFTKFRFEGSFSVDEFKIFLRSQGNMQELNLSGFTFLNSDDSPLESFNIRDLPGVQQLTSFCVEGEEGTHLMISLSHLGAIKTLSVARNATFEMNKVITPIKLKIGGPSAGVKFTGINPKEDTVNLCDLFDMSILTELEFVSPGKFIKLDLARAPKLKCGIFQKHSMAEGQHDPPIVKDVEILAIGPREMNLHLPKSTESLYFKAIPPKQFSFKLSAELRPKLRTVVCNGYIPNEVLSVCPNLSTLSIIDAKLDLGGLPANFRDLNLVGDNWEVVGNREYPMNLLVVFEFGGRWQSLDDLVDRIHSQAIMLYKPSMFKDKTFEEMCSQNIFEKVFATIQKQIDKGGRFISTKIRWLEYERVSEQQLKLFEKSPFLCLVDKSPPSIHFFPMIT